MTGPRLIPDQQAEQQARKLLNRYGIVAREIVNREALLSWPFIARELQKLELRGEVRRGYFVEGLSGMQFGHPHAVDMIRQTDGRSSTTIALLNACDPANPYGPGVPLDDEMNGAPTLSRQPQHYLALAGGSPAVMFESMGTRIWTRAGITDDQLGESLRLFLTAYWSEHGPRPFREVHMQYLNGARPGGSPSEQLLRTIGFYRDRDQTMRWSEYR